MVQQPQQQQPGADESVERALAYAPFLAEGDLTRLADALAAAEARRGGVGGK